MRYEEPSVAEPRICTLATEDRVSLAELGGIHLQFGPTARICMQKVRCTESCAKVLIISIEHLAFWFLALQQTLNPRLS